MNRNIFSAQYFPSDLKREDIIAAVGVALAVRGAARPTKMKKWSEILGQFRERGYDLLDEIDNQIEKYESLEE